MKLSFANIYQNTVTAKCFHHSKEQKHLILWFFPDVPQFEPWQMPYKLRWQQRKITNVNINMKERVCDFDED